MEIDAIEFCANVDLFLEEEEGKEEYQLWHGESEELDAEKQERIDETVKQYAARFKSKLGKKKFVERENPLRAPPMKDEGRRDQKTMKIEKYFGDHSRQEFFGRSNWIRDKCNIINKGDNIAEKVVMTPKLDYSVDFAFAPRRFDDLGDDEYDEDNDDDDDDDNEEDAEAVDKADAQVRRLGLGIHSSYTSAPTNLAATDSSVCTFESGSTLHTSCTAIERGTPTSPRTRYIGNCINSKINPRASLILRKHVSTELKLRHQVSKSRMFSMLCGADG
jgi:hypothetical protein